MKRSLILAASIATLTLASPASAQLNLGLGAQVGVGTHVGVQANANASTRESRRHDDRRWRHRRHDRDDLRANGSFAAQSRLHTRHYRTYGETRGDADFRG